MVNAQVHMNYDIAAVDVGNTHVTTAYLRQGQLVLTKAVRTNFVRSKVIIKPSKIIIGSSVVPKITKLIQRDYPLAKIIKTNDVPVKKLPAHIGTDRAINMYAASTLYKSSNILVIDFGTALTFSCSINNTFVGGLIMPGLKLMQEALGKTAKLPVVRSLQSDGVLQIDTDKAIKSGIYTSVSSAVSSTIDQIKKETGQELLVVSTGGNALELSENIGGIQIVNPTLIHEGLVLLANS